MNRVATFIKEASNSILRNSPTKQFMASVLLLAMLLPIGAPVPAWAYAIAAQTESNKKLAVSVPEPSFSEKLSGLAKNVAMFLPSIGDDKDVNKTNTETPSKKELENKLASFKTEISEKEKISVGDSLSLAALPLDKDGKTINGISLRWKSSKPEILQVNANTEATALKKGEAKLTLYSETKELEFLIKIEESSPIIETESQAILNSPTSSAVNDPVEEEQYAESLFIPQNNLGSPAGQTEMSALMSSSTVDIKERAGSANYSFGLPVAGLSGRGLNASVEIAYNSRVWTKSSILSSDVFTYNADKNWLAPGFMLGYGYMDRFRQSNSLSNWRYSLTSANGTRSELTLKQQTGGINSYESSDGSFIATSIANNAEGTAATMEVLFPNGSKVLYGTSHSTGQYGNFGRRFPIKITDRNGNIILITYLSGNGEGKISSIKDTLGRYINFHYDNSADKKLVAVTVPGFNGSSTERQTIRFYYETMNLEADNCFPSQQNKYCFDTGNLNGTVTWAPQTIDVLKYVYYPGTQMGYKYHYSPYFGTIYKIEQLRGMQVSTIGTSQTGTVTSDGVSAASTEYNYPVTSNDLNGYYDYVPKYTKRTDDWLGRTGSTAPETTFSINEQLDGNGVGTSITTITNPDGRKNISVSNVNPNQWDDGLLEETKIVTGSAGSETVWTKTKMFWEQGTINGNGGRNNPRLDKIERTNDAGQTRATSFEYDSYNNQTLVKEHDFAPSGQLGTELRRTEVTYETNSNWINNRLFSLAKEVKTKVGGVYVSKTKYEYDGDTLELRNDIDSTTHTTVSAYRGNLTKVTAFSDATLSSDSNASITTTKYDVAGNPVEAGLNCCQLRTWTYDKANEYAYPISETSGNSGQLANHTTYDFNTGLAKSTTDENGNVTSYTYDADSLRLTRTDAANGAWATTEFNDDTYPFHVKYTSSLDSSRSVSSWTYRDGRGQTFRSRGQTANGYISSDVEFDELGRVEKSFQPYTVANLTDTRPGGIKYTEVTQRDDFGRTTETTLPDLTTVQASYDGLVRTVTDQAGKQRRQVYDVLGRLIRVDEPDSNGNLGLVTSPIHPTSYEYDGNDNLTKITQTGNGATQVREFKYDSLSRLTHEKQVEATAKLNDAGQTGGNQWTKYYNYNSYNLLNFLVDARGVKTTFLYDGLNRVKTVTYTGETGYQTPKVTYTYDEARNDPNSNPYSNNGRLTKVETQGISDANQETPAIVHLYDYDKVGQIVDHTQTIGAESYNLKYAYNLAGQLTSQTYPSGKVVTNTIDDHGTLQTVADAQETYLSGITLNGQGLLTGATLGNGTSETFSYNDRFQMTSQSLLKGTEVLQKYDYSYGEVNTATGAVDAAKNNGQLGKIDSYIGTSQQWSQRFGYDELGRLKEASEYKLGDNNQLSYKQVFDYDRFGNLYRKAANNPTGNQQNPLSFEAIEDTHINKSNNRLTDSTTYDDAGQVTTDNKFRNLNFAYDGNGRRIKTTAANTDASTVYDALGNRVATRSYDVWRYMIYDAFGKLVAEYGVKSEGLGGVKYVQADWQGSVRSITNNNGFVVARTDHQAFGGEVGYGTGTRSIEQGYSVDKVATQSFGLTEEDKASGQQHTWARMLETESGRWTRPDPYNGSIRVTNPQSFNRYSYVTNDPVNIIDPSGLDGCYFVFRGTLNGRPLYSTHCSVDVYAPGSERVGGGGGRVGVFQSEVGQVDGNERIGGGRPSPSGPSKECSLSLKEIASCVKRCMNAARVDKFARAVGESTGIPYAGDFLEGLTWVGTGAAIGNQVLNATSLGRYPRSPAGGKKTKGGRTSWQHRVFGNGGVGGAVRRAGFSRAGNLIGLAGKVVGRAAVPISVGLLVFEGAYTTGTFASCSAICSRKSKSCKR